MRLLLIGCALSALVLPGCTRQGRQAAWGAPYTDITKTSSEPGAYARPSPYYIISETREGQQLTIDVNVTNTGKIDQVGRQVVDDRRDGASTVTVHVYESDEKPPSRPWRTVQWTAANGFTRS